MLFFNYKIKTKNLDLPFKDKEIHKRKIRIFHGNNYVNNDEDIKAGKARV